MEKLRAENPAAVEGCSATAGLSLGEYTALVFSGAMTFKDGLRVRFYAVHIHSTPSFIESSILAYGLCIRMALDAPTAKHSHILAR